MLCVKCGDALAVEPGQRLGRAGDRVSVRRRRERDALRDETRERARVAVTEREVADRLRAHALDLGRRERRLPHDLIEERERGRKDVRQRGERDDRGVVTRCCIQTSAQTIDRLRDFDRRLRCGALGEQRRGQGGETRLRFVLGRCTAAKDHLRRDQRHGVRFGRAALREGDHAHAVGQRSFHRQRQIRAMRSARRRRLFEGGERFPHSGRYSIVVRFATVRY